MFTLNQQISSIRNDLNNLKINANTTDFSGGIMEYTIFTMTTLDDIIHQLDDVTDTISGENLRINETITSLSGSIDTINSNLNNNTYSTTISGDISLNSLTTQGDLTICGTIINTELEIALSGKQDILIAGNNITIVDNVISASGEVIQLQLDEKQEKLTNTSDLSLNHLHVLGDLFVDGSFNINNVIQNDITINNEILISTQLDISNEGTGPALKITQLGSGPDKHVALFNAGEEGDSLLIDSSGNTTIYKKLEVFGDVSMNHVIIQTLDVSNLNIDNGTLAIDKIIGLQNALSGLQPTIQDNDLSISDVSGLQNALSGLQPTIQDNDLSISDVSGLQNALSGKQDVLSAGNNITIVDNVISSSGTGGAGGSGGSGIFNLSNNIYYYDSTPLGIGTSDVSLDFALTISGGLYLTGDQTSYLNSDLYWLKDNSNNIYIEDINTFGLGTEYIDLSFTNKLDVSGNVLFRNNLNVNETIHCSNLNLNGIDMYNTIIDLSSSASTSISSTGTTVNTSYKIYDKFVTTNIGNWIPIDNNIDTGFVASFIPTSSNSKILIQCTLHVSVANGTDSRWWGANLYRKIGSSDWEEVVGATNNNTVNRPAGTGCFMTSHHQAGQDFFIQNLGNSYVDDAVDNINTHYYTIYWKCRIGNNDNGKIINLNRAHSSTDAFRSLPVSSIIIQEIYYP